MINGLAQEAAPPALPLLPVVFLANMKIDKGHGEMVY